MKLSVEHILKPITHIINTSIKSGIVPSKMKIAKIVPIFKKGNVTDPANYRPVSLLPCLSKILERVMYNKVLKFLDLHNILYSHQYGFRTKHSTIHPIIHLLHDCAL